MARQIKPDILYVDKSYYFAACSTLLWEIEKLMSSNSLKFNSLVAIAKGGLIVGAYLAFKLEMHLDVVYAQSYKGTEQGKLTVMIPDHIALAGKTYLLVDDLYHGGRTIRTVMKKMEPAHTIPVTLFRKEKTGLPLIDKFAGYTKSWIKFFYESDLEKKELLCNEIIHQEIGVDGWQEIYADAPSEEDIRAEMAEDGERGVEIS